MQRKIENNTTMPSAEVQEMIPKIQAYLATQPVERAYLFGSCSRGEETKDSDVDLLVKYINADQLSLMDISRMMVNLGRQLNRKVDLVEEDYLLPFAQASVNHDKIKIYERKS